MHVALFVRLKAAVAGLLVAFGASAQAPAYTFQLLDRLQTGTFATAWDINNSGVIVGSAYNSFLTGPGFFPKPVTWTPSGTVSELGMVGQTGGNARAINNAGQIVGVENALGGVAVLWQNGQPAVLGPTTTARGPQAINAQGVVVGANPRSPFGYAAVMWVNGGVVELTTPWGAGDSIATDINSSRQIVGASSEVLPNTGSIVNRATRWSDGAAATQLAPLIDGGGAGATGINDQGDVVGSAQYEIGSPRTHAVLWKDGAVFDLGALGGISSEAFDINESGQIVGTFQPSPTQFNRAALWYGAQAFDLNSFLDATSVNAGWVLVDAFGINDLGQIVGRARNVSLNETRGFVMTPVPEPTTYAMIATGLALVGFAHARRRRA